MSDTESINVDTLAALVKSQAALIEQLSGRLGLQEQAAGPRMLDINDVRAQPDPRFRDWSTVYRRPVLGCDPKAIYEGLETRIVQSKAAREAALADGWYGYAHHVAEAEATVTAAALTAKAHAKKEKAS